MQAHDALDTSPRQTAIKAVVIGASAGGVDALLRLLSGLPEQFRLPVVTVLHMPDDRESRLVEIFQNRSALRVSEAADKAHIEPGVLYFAGAGYHLSVEADRTFSLSCEARVHFSRPAIDVLMSSAADAYGQELAGILLTGANYDGAAGLAKIRRCGGLTVVQDPLDALVPTMPEAAIRMSQPNLILKLDDIRSLLIQLDRNSC